MTNLQGRLFRRIATRGVVAALPVAMAAAYASGLFIQPPRLAAQLDYTPVAEITSSPTTIGIADSPMFWMSRAEIDKQLDQMLSIGVTSVRVLIPWAVIEPADNQYDWSRIQDVMDAAAQRNMGVLADINATPIWAATNPGLGSILFPGSDYPKIDAFVDFVKTFVAKYANTVSAYEIWNEPNYVGFSNPIDPEGYAALLKAIYPIIKDPVSGLDKTATVVAGSLGAGQSTGITMSPVEFVQRMVAAGALGYFDALSIHPYSQEIPITGSCPTCPDWMLTPSQQLNAIKDMIDGKKIWITEYGLPTTPVDGGMTQQQQSDWLKQMLDYWQTFGSQAGPMFLYNTRDAAANSTNPEDNFGLFYNNWDPKDAAAMVKAWIAAHLVPVTPNPVASNPIAQFFAAIQQAFQSFGQLFSQLFNPFSFVQSFIQGIANLFGFGAPAPAAVVTTSAPVQPAAARLALTAADTASADPSLGGSASSDTNAVAPASEPEVSAATAVTPAAESVAQEAVSATVAVEAVKSEVTQAESAPISETTPAVVSAGETTDSTATVSAPKAAATADTATVGDAASGTASSTASSTTSPAKAEASESSSTKTEKTSSEKTSSSTSSSEKSSASSSSTSSSSTGSSSSSSTGTSSSSASASSAKPKPGSDSGSGGAGGSSSSGSSGDGGSGD